MSYDETVKIFMLSSMNRYTLYIYYVVYMDNAYALQIGCIQSVVMNLSVH